MANSAHKESTKGRPSKGARLRVVTRVNPALHRRIVKSAQSKNQSVSEYIAEMLGHYV